MIALLLFCSVLVLIIVIDISIASEERDGLSIIKVLLDLFLIILFNVLINCSSPLLDNTIKNYEQGNIMKEYTIIGDDTTYRYVYKKIKN